VCFSDTGADVPGWEMRTAVTVFQHPKADALRFKCLPHLWFPHAAAWIWLDACLMPVDDPRLLLKHLGNADIALFPHPLYKCVYHEMNVNAQAGYRNVDADRAELQRQHLRDIGYPEKYGLGVTSVLIRRNTERIRRFNEAWWADICRWATWRDQYSFDPVCWQLGIEYKRLGPVDVRNDVRWNWRRHR
jgi:hypothetical protein